MEKRKKIYISVLTIVVLLILLLSLYYIFFTKPDIVGEKNSYDNPPKEPPSSIQNVEILDENNF